MKVLLDTPIWSFALRRPRRKLSGAQQRVADEWAALVRDKRVMMIGPVRQELLSGVRSGEVFERLRDALRAFPDEPLTTEDYEEAGRCCNTCRAAGLSGSSVDYLICAVALRRGAALFTTDVDFRRYAQCVPLRLHSNP